MWVANFDEGFDATETNNIITDINDDAGTDLTFYKFELPVDLGDAVEEISADPKLGTSFVTLTINGSIIGLTASTSKIVNDMMKSKQRLIAELYNIDDSGETLYVLYGEQNGVDMTAGGSRTGAEGASLQGYEITWTGQERDYAAFVDGSKVVKVEASGTLKVTSA